MKDGIKLKKILSVMVISFMLIISYVIYLCINEKKPLLSENEKSEHLAVFVDNEKVEEFPSKNSGYIYLGVDCENASVASFDEVEWKLKLVLNSSDSCNVYFKTATTTMANSLMSNSSLYTDSEGNKRYNNVSPSNYVYYNCDDLLNPSSETCELWRIIGVYKSVSNGSSYESRVKIVRDDSIGNYSWDNKNVETGAETDGGLGIWENSELQKLLNGPYFYREKGNCAYGQNNVTTSCDFSNTGIKNNAKVLIDKAVWRLGAHLTWESDANTFLQGEINGVTYNNRPSTWLGYIGLMTAADYAFSVAANYYTTLLNNYNSAAASTSWIYKDYENVTQWTISAYAANTHNVFFVQSDGNLDHYRAYLTNSVRPAVFLKSTVSIVGGNGTKDNPYIIR